MYYRFWVKGDRSRSSHKSLTSHVVINDLSKRPKYYDQSTDGSICVQSFFFQWHVFLEVTCEIVVSSDTAKCSKISKELTTLYVHFTGVSFNDKEIQSVSELYWKLCYIPCRWRSYCESIFVVWIEEFQNHDTRLGSFDLVVVKTLLQKPRDPQDALLERILIWCKFLKSSLFT